MNNNLESFLKQLKKEHYSSVFIEHLANTIDQHKSQYTLHEINAIIQRQTNSIINYFKEHNQDISLIEYRNPLCFESLRHYFDTMTRGVYKRYGNHLQKFKEGLKIKAKELIEILAAATNRIVKNSELLLRDNSDKKIMVYSYSKSICLSLEKLSKVLEDNLVVYICRSGSLNEGVKLYEELMVKGVRCELLNDNQIGYYIHQMTCVIVGAQVILDNGAILNRAGTSMVALLAHHARKPFYVFAQAYKFLRKTFLCQQDIPQSFHSHKQMRSISIDLTHAEYITMFCTQSGIYNPQVISLQLSKILI